MRNKSYLLIVLALLAPIAVQAQAPATTSTFRVDSDASWIRVLAWPDGPLKRFGHHHVISHDGISGTVEVAEDPLQSNIMLEIDVQEFAVDDPELRALEGEEFEGEVPQKDIEGTRNNMLSEKLLDGEQFQTIQIESGYIEGSLPDVNIVATVTVKGVENTVKFPATVELTDDSVVARGELELLHGAFGLSPFTAMGGALSVRDLLVLKYEITGVRDTDDAR
jgi:polyisoprenoid-binding protein YceI